jgi:DNA-binding NarL/FixJ family response regulator
VIDRRVLIRDCLTRCLSQISEFEIVGALSVDEWLEQSKSRDVVAVLLSLTGCPATDANKAAIRKLCAARPEPVIVLSEGESLDQIVNVFADGARGYIPTSLDLDMAIDALWLVKSGGAYLPRSSLAAAQQLRAPSSGDGGRDPLEDIFTGRQREVLDGLRQGKANKIIAYELNMCESTVKVHIRNIMKKLQAKNRTEVAYKANELLRRESALPPRPSRLNGEGLVKEAFQAARAAAPA